MTSGITGHAMKRHRGSLVGAASTQLLAGLIIATMVNAAASLNRTLTPPQKVPPSVVDALEVTGVFIGISVYVTMIVVGVTMNLATVAQLSDIALLRTIGATPGQVRRSLVTQAGLVAIGSALVGSLLAVPVAWAWIGSLRAHQVVPASTGFAVDVRSIPLAVGIVVATSIVGTAIGVLRVSRMSPAAALVEVTTGRRGGGPIRTVAGLVLVAAGVTLSSVLSVLAPGQAGDAAVFVLLAECIGVGLLGPVILSQVSRLLRPVVGGGLGRVAVDDLATMTRSLSGALIPMVLSASFAAVKVASHTSAPPGVELGAADEVWADVSGTAIYCAFAAVAALNCFISVITARGPSLAAMRLAGASRHAIITVVSVQAAIVTAVAVGLAAVVACATMAPALHQSLGLWLPRVPIGILALGVMLVGGVVAAGMIGPAVRLTTRPVVAAAKVGP